MATAQFPEDIETLNSVFDLLPDKTEFRTEKPDLNIIFNSGSINAISCSGKIESQLGLAISKTDSPEEIADKLVNLLSLSQDKWGDSGKMEEALKLLIGLMMDLSEKAGQTSTHAKKDVRV